MSSFQIAQLFKKLYLKALESVWVAFAVYQSAKVEVNALNVKFGKYVKKIARHDRFVLKKIKDFLLR